MPRSIHVRFQDEQQDAIEKFRRDELDLPTKPEAVRRLVERALAAARKAEAKSDDDRRTAA
jgi:hypothetical protein